MKVSHGEHGDGGSGKGGEGHSDGHVVLAVLLVVLLVFSIVFIDDIFFDDFFFDLDTGGPGPGFEGCSFNGGGLSSDVSIGGSSKAEETTSDIAAIDDRDRAAPVVSGLGI